MRKTVTVLVQSHKNSINTELDILLYMFPMAALPPFNKLGFYLCDLKSFNKIEYRLKFLMPVALHVSA
jgi:hypothetical protein